jgi:predicted permease
MRRSLARFANLFRRRRAEREMTRAIESHLALIQEDFERAGMSPREAALAARRTYGGVDQAKELHRDARTYVWIEQLAKDVYYAARTLQRAPGFTLVATIALALGLGVNTTVFAVLDALVLKPLPVADPDRVVRLARWSREQQSDSRFSTAEYQYLRDGTTTFAGLVASWGDPNAPSGGMRVLASIGGSAAQERMRGRVVSANYFAVLGETPVLGRFFRPDEDDAAGASPVVVLAWRFWQRRMAGNRNVVGQTVKLSGLPYTVIGIAPEKFTGTDSEPTEFDFWAPLSMTGQLDAAFNGKPRLQLLARLKRGVPRAQAQAETTLLFRQYLTASHQPDRAMAITLKRTRYLEVDDPADLYGMEAAAAAMWIVVSLILGAACANVANMLLARGASRQREIGIRLAMGASRGRVIRQLLLESVLLSVLGCIAAIPLSLFAGRSLWLSLAAIPGTTGLNMPAPDLRPDAHLLAYGLILSIVIGVLFGLPPALEFTRLELNRSMKEDGSSFGARFRRSRLRGALMGSQAAVSLLLLLVSGALFTRFHDVRTSDLGFDIPNTYVVDAEDEDRLRADLWTLRNRVAALPEIAGNAIGIAPSGNDDGALPMKAGKWDGTTFATTVSDGYFETMRMRLERGRGFAREEMGGHAAVAVITESTARRCWPKQDPLGKLLSLTWRDTKSKVQRADFEVVGVVNDVRQADMIRIDPLRVYLPTGTPASPNNSLIFRIRGNRTKALAAVQSAVEAVDPKLLPGLTLFSLEEGNIAGIRAFYGTMAAVAGILALLAVTLAVVGIYGVMAFLVSQRTREIGVRMALGATARMLLKSTVLQGLRPVLIGMVFGFGSAVGLDAWDRSTDLLPETLLNRLFGGPAVCAEIALMLVLTVLASAVPVIRALRVDPMAALRHE